MLGAIIVTHRRADLALACLRSLSDTVNGRHIVVVVNDPGEANPAQLATLRDTARVIENPAPVGYAANINRGAAAMPTRVHDMLLLNDDLCFETGAIDCLCSALHAASDIAVASPALVGEDGDHQAVCFRFPSIRSEFAQMLIAPARVLDALRGGDASPALPGCARVDWVLGAAMLVRREAFDAVHGFDEGFAMYSEETDFCRRLADRGWGCIACGDARAVHLGGASTANTAWTGVLAQSRHRYLARHWPARRRAALAAAFLLACAWNVAYVATSLMIRPRHRAASLDALRSRVVNRVTLRVRVQGS